MELKMRTVYMWVNFIKKGLGDEKCEFLLDKYTKWKVKTLKYKLPIFLYYKFL